MGAVPAGLRCQPFVGFDWLLVAGTPVRDLFIGAKYLFFAAMAAIAAAGELKNEQFFFQP